VVSKSVELNRWVCRRPGCKLIPCLGVGDSETVSAAIFPPPMEVPEGQQDSWSCRCSPNLTMPVGARKKLDYCSSQVRMGAPTIVPFRAGEADGCCCDGLESLERPGQPAADQYRTSGDQRTSLTIADASRFSNQPLLRLLGAAAMRQKAHRGGAEGHCCSRRRTAPMSSTSPTFLPPSYL